MSVYSYNLLIESYRSEILDIVAQSRVCVIKGPTGCGKSTYVPHLLSSSSARIAIIEPRRIAVTSLYSTLSTVTENVGYKMRFNKTIDRDTRVIVYTDGSFLNEMSSNSFDYIIVDEVHERSIRTDIILAILKSSLDRTSSKIVLMSATVDTDKIAGYFGASVLDIPGESYPCRIEYSPECISDYIVESYCIIKKIAASKEEVWEGFEKRNRDILVFLPGEEDINELYVLLRKLLVVKVYKIFSALSDAEQGRIYEKCSLRKVILSTNICETSLTIPGIGYVIDSGLCKVKVYDQISYLGICPVSKESADQRLGRCNRTGAGVCYRLYPRSIYNELPSQTPEICRSDLSQVILQLAGYKKNVFRMELLDYPTIANTVGGLRLLLRKDCIKIVDRRNGRELQEEDFAEEKPDGWNIDDIQLRITNYGRILLQHPFDVHLAHFYQQALNRSLGYFASILLSLISQDNYNFLRGIQECRTDAEQLVCLFEAYLECEDRKAFCTKQEVSLKGMRRAEQIFSTLNKQKGGDLEALERVFGHAYSHNLSERVGDGSYRHLESGNIVWIHPKSSFFKRQDKLIVFVDVFSTSKPYARVVGRHFKNS